MKIRVKKNVKVDLNTLIRIERRGLLPVLIVHERFERPIKWLLRTFAAIGIATSLLTIDDWFLNIGFAILLFLIEQFFERAIFEYTSFYLIPLPDFDIDHTQWQTNGFIIPQNIDDNHLCYVGPTFRDREYAVSFFNYLTKWNWDSFIDDENVIVLSIVLEPNSEYTMYIYSNPSKRNLDEIFKKDAEKKKFSKYGKKQQQLFTQMIFWKKLEYNENYFIHQFLEKQATKGKFYFVPSVLPKAPQESIEFLFEYAIVKYGFKLKKRSDIDKSDLEYYCKP